MLANRNLPEKMQDLQSFTVQILRAESEDIVGTGFIISQEGLIATCLHVVQIAMGSGKAADLKVGIYFPHLRVRGNARVLQERQLPDDDIAILQLVDQLPAGAAVAVLGASQSVEDHPFRCYGFRALPPFSGGPASGMILGNALREPDSLLRYAPLHLRSPEIDQGMSGGPVLDLNSNRVIGMITAVWRSSSARDRDTAFAVPSEALCQLVPNLPLIPDMAAPKPRWYQRKRWIALVVALLVLTALAAFIIQAINPFYCGPRLSYAGGYIYRARQHRDNGEYACAIRDLQDGLKTSPTAIEQADSYYVLSSILLVEGKPAEAVDYANQGLGQMNSPYPLLYLSRGLSYCVMDQNDKARSDIDAFLAAGGNAGVPDDRLQEILQELARGTNMRHVCYDLGVVIP